MVKNRGHCGGKVPWIILLPIMARTFSRNKEHSAATYVTRRGDHGYRYNIVVHGPYNMYIPYGTHGI